MNNLPSILEAILFASGKEESPKKLAQVLKIKTSQVKKALIKLKEGYQNRGLKLLEKDGKVELVTDPQYAQFLEKYWQKKLREKLSPLALETLAIIAYRGPLSRYQIEEIRGVNSVFVLHNLLRRGLIERKIQGKKIYYEITANFLRHLGLIKVSQLPKYNEFKKRIINNEL